MSSVQALHVVDVCLCEMKNVGQSEAAVVMELTVVRKTLDDLRSRAALRYNWVAVRSTGYQHKYCASAAAVLGPFLCELLS